MPTTPAGTAYTVHTFTNSVGDPSRWVIPDAVAAASAVPTVLYAHGAGGGASQFTDLAAWAPLRNLMLDAGWAYIETRGAGDNWGNAAGRASYRAAFDHAAANYDVGPVIVLGRSMGGLVAYWLFTQDPVIAARSVGFIGNSPTTDLAWRFFENPNNHASLMAAYGMTSDDQYATATAGHDPMLFPLSAWAGRHMLWCVGDADTSVPPDHNALALFEQIRGELAYGYVEVKPGGTHGSGSSGTYNMVDQMWPFMQARAAGEDLSPPPPSRPQLRVRFGGSVHRVARVRRSGVSYRVAAVRAGGVTRYR